MALIRKRSERNNAAGVRRRPCSSNILHRVGAARRILSWISINIHPRRMYLRREIWRVVVRTWIYRAVSWMLTLKPITVTESGLPALCQYSSTLHWRRHKNGALNRSINCCLAIAFSGMLCRCRALAVDMPHWALSDAFIESGFSVEFSEWLVRLLAAGNRYVHGTRGVSTPSIYAS